MAKTRRHPDNRVTQTRAETISSPHRGEIMCKFCDSSEAYFYTQVCFCPKFKFETSTFRVSTEDGESAVMKNVSSK